MASAQQNVTGQLLRDAAAVAASIGSAAAPGEGKSFPLMSRDEVESLVAEGRKVVIFNNFVLKVDGWIRYHPGGEKAILHMVGRDATDEMTVLHSAEARQRMLKYRIGRVEGIWTNFIPPIQGGKFRTKAEIEGEKDDKKPTARDIDSSSTSSRAPSPVFDNDEGARKPDIRKREGKGRSSSVSSLSTAEDALEDLDGITFLDALTHEKIRLDLEKYPAPDLETQAHIVKKYRELHQKIIDAGLYECNYTAYGWECFRYALFFGLGLVSLRFGYYALAGGFIGFMWHLLVFSAHDAGHMGITHNFHVDTVIGIIIADFIGGLSLCWWKHNHNVHHIVTNSPEHDPDIEHMPIFAISHRFFNSLRSTFYDRVMTYDAAARILLRVQPYTYYPFLAFGRFNLYFLSWDFILAGRGPRKGAAAWHRWLEVAGQIFFWSWYGYGIVYKSIPDNWSRFAFVMVSHIICSPLHVQIVLSHFAMSTADLGPQESFAQKMLRTTMDVDCPTWMDFYHGGLQHQVIHHLFPRVPRHNLHTARKMVIEFCKEVDVPYAYYGFTRCNKLVIGRLAEVSRQAALYAKCQDTIVKSGDFYGHHH